MTSDCLGGACYNRPTMERVVLVEHLLSALPHLADPTSLLEHPLGPLLLPGVASAERGLALANLLDRAIEGLRPSGSGEAHVGSLRRYQYLDRRYRQGLRAAVVAQDLGLSERQARRIQQEAVEALAGIIWSQRQDRGTVGGSAETRTGSDVATSGTAVTSERDAEITRIGATPAQAGAGLSDTIRGATITIESLARQRGVQLELEAAPSLPPIAIERAVLRQIFVNLLVAVIEHGARRVTIRTNVLPDAAKVTLLLRFRGTSGRSFTDQFGADESLRVARRLLQLQSATVAVEPVDLAAVAIVLHLPVVQPPTVLLVDDNPDTLRLLRRYLNGSALRPVDASNGQQALELARQVRPKAIVLDVMMPNQDGWEILQALKHDGDTEAIPVVICSVLQQRELARSLGAADFLEKPISRDALLLALRRQLASPPVPPAQRE